MTPQVGCSVYSDGLFKYRIHSLHDNIVAARAYSCVAKWSKKNWWSKCGHPRDRAALLALYVPCLEVVHRRLKRGISKLEVDTELSSVQTTQGWQGNFND